MDAQPPDQPQPQYVPRSQPETPTVAWGAPPPPAPPGTETGFTLSDFISFRYLITPAFVTVIYVIGVVVIVLIALGAVFSGSSGSGGGAGGILAAILILIFGNLYWRIILEFVMVLFRMNDSLKSIDRRGRGM
jgi:hypothetical protein